MSKKSAGGPPHKGMPLTTIFGAVEACHVGPITRHSRGPFPWLPCMRQRGPQFAEKGKTGDWLICRWSLLVDNDQITLHVGPHKLPFLLLVCYCGTCVVWISLYGLRTWMDKERVQMCIRERCRGGVPTNVWITVRESFNLSKLVYIWVNLILKLFNLNQLLYIYIL